MVLRSHVTFWQAHVVQVFLLKPNSFQKLSTGLGSTNKSVTSPPPALMFSQYFLCLNLSGKNCLFSLSSFPISYNGSPDTHSFRTTTWPGKPCHFCLWQSFSPFVPTLLFSRTGGIRSPPNCLTDRSPSVGWNKKVFSKSKKV